MKKIIDKFKWLQLLFGLVLIALGVLTIVIAVNADKDSYEKTIFIVWASVLFFIAAVIVIFDIIAFNDKAEFSALVAAGICVGVGIFVLPNQDFISNVVKTLIPYIIVSIGGVLLLKTIILAVKKVPFKQWLLPFVLSVIFVAAGVVFICVKDLSNIIYIALGILFIALGAVEIIGFITVIVNKKAPRNDLQPVKQPKKPKKVKKKEEEEPAPVFDEEEEIVDATPKQIESEDDIKLIE